MITCLIIEDQLPAQRILKKYCQDMPQLKLVGTYTHAKAAQEVLNSQQIDLLFLDIHLPQVSGIEFLKSLSHPPQVILCTAFSEFALESYELNVVDYLLKPFSFIRFEIAVNKALDKIAFSKQTNNKNVPETTSIYIKSGHDHYQVAIDTIVYINSDADYTDVYTTEQKYIASESLKHWEEKLVDFGFLRIHKSYIINLKKIKKTTARFVVVEGDYKIPIGRTYKTILQNRLHL